jgi:lipoprotein NlpI
MVQFRRANIKESIADFDAYLKLKPSEAPNLWQRGISYYYAKQYAEGRKQFELHQMVNSDDVENAVWHFLCVAQIEGKEKARALLMPVGRDLRVPMAEIYALFAGRGTPEQVFQAVERGQVAADIRQQRQFYANLYLGLYYEAMGDPAKAEEHITQAVGPYKVDHYMGDVARVHAKLRGYAIAK